LKSELVETLKAKQSSNDVLRVFNEQDSLHDIIDDIKKHHKELELVLLGAGVTDPVQMVQRIHAIDKSVSVIVLVEEADALQTKRAFQFAPFIGDQVQCVASNDLDLVLNAVGTSIQTTRNRRNHSRVISQLNRSMYADRSRSVEAQVASPHFDKLLDIAPVGVALIDQNGNILAWNKSAQQLSGLNEREAILLQLQSVFSFDREDDLLATLIQAQSANTPITVEVFRPMQGGVRYFEITAGSLGF
jgi:PAS domain S-box-containing protein